MVIYNLHHAHVFDDETNHIPPPGPTPQPRSVLPKGRSGTSGPASQDVVLCIKCIFRHRNLFFCTVIKKWLEISTR